MDTHPDQHWVTFIADDGRYLRAGVTTEQRQHLESCGRRVTVHGSLRGPRLRPDPRPART